MREGTHPIQRILNVIISRFLSRKFEGYKVRGWGGRDTFITLKEEKQNKKPKKRKKEKITYIQQSCPSKMSKKLSHFKIKVEEVHYH